MIDDVHTQAAQAGLHLGSNHFGLEIWDELPLVVPRAATLGGDQRAGSHLSQSAPDHLLGMAGILVFRKAHATCLRRERPMLAFFASPT